MVDGRIGRLHHDYTDVLTADLVPLIERYVGYSKTMDFTAKRALWDADALRLAVLEVVADQVAVAVARGRAVTALRAELAGCGRLRGPLEIGTSSKGA